MEGSSKVNSRYSLSFTTGGLLERETRLLAPLYLEHHDWTKVRELALEDNLLQARTRSTGVRRVRETIKRMTVLSDHELELLLEVTASERCQLMWAAACRRFDLIGEFAEEVLRERFLTLAGTVSYADFDSFYRTKALWHDELGMVTQGSYTKFRQVLFRMMLEADLVSEHGVIEAPLLSARVVECLNRREPSDVRFFPTKDT